MTESIRIACVTDPTRRHAFFMAAPASGFERLLAAYDRDEGLSAEPFEFTDPQITSETEAWIAAAAEESERPPLVMVGSVENGQWVSWNLASIPRPPVPTY